jgi:hypothetical protein
MNLIEKRDASELLKSEVGNIMNTSEKRNTSELIKEIDRIAYVLSILLIMGLIALYYFLWQNKSSFSNLNAFYDLGLSLIPNFIPVLVVFVISYAIFRNIQRIRSLNEKEELTENIAQKTNSILSPLMVDIKTRIGHINRLVTDSIETGIEQVCDSEETTNLGIEELKSTSVVKVIGIGNSWLLAEPHKSRLDDMLTSGCQIHVLIPDPLSPEVIERYEKDEPKSAKLGLNGIARRVIKWYEMKQRHPSLNVRIFNRYPVVNLSIYDKHVYASSVLYQKRGFESLTVIFRRPSKGAEIYEDHFDQVYLSGSVEITPSYLHLLKSKFNM